MLPDELAIPLFELHVNRPCGRGAGFVAHSQDTGYHVQRLVLCLGSPGSLHVNAASRVTGKCSAQST